MKKILTVLGIITSVLALILATTPLSKIALIPCIAAFIFGVLALTVPKNKEGSKKSIQLIFLMTIIALALTTYKAIFNTVEVGDTEQLEQKEEKLEEESLKELEELDIDEIDGQ